MQTQSPRDDHIEEETEPEHPLTPEGIRIFEADAWIPMWDQSIPGEKLALGSVPTTCNLYLDPDPHFAIEVNLGGNAASEHHRILTQQGEQVPMQFAGLQYDNYPVRGNNFVTWEVNSDGMQLHAKYRLLGNGLRILRIGDAPIAEVRGFFINLAIDNHRPLTIHLDNWVVRLSPQQRIDDNESTFAITHHISITNENGAFSNAELAGLRADLRIAFSVLNVQCCEIVLTQTLDAQSSLTGYIIDQLHCDPFSPDVLQYSIMSSQRDAQVKEVLSKIYRQVHTSPPQYLEALELLTCGNHESIPSLWSILEKTCGSGRSNVRRALLHCVESTRIPSEYTFLTDELNAEQDADFVDIFYAMRNHFAHEKNKIAQGRLVSPETQSIVKQLGQLLCWSKVLTDVDVKCLLWQEARVSFADWEFTHNEGQPSALKKFQADGTYNAFAAIRRILRGGETPGRASAYFETPEGEVMLCEATDWPKEMPQQ